jgi:hypothetical protein
MPRGSAPGERRGGRQKGTPNKATIIERRMRAQAGLEAAKRTGVMPLDIMLAVAAGGPEADQISDRQLQAAIAAAPYVHPKLAAVAVKDMTPPNPAREEKARRAREELIRWLNELARREPLLIEHVERPRMPDTHPPAPHDWPP